MSMDTMIKAYLAEIGRKGGSARTEAKARAVRANGLKGGRPKGSKGKPKPVKLDTLETVSRKEDLPPFSIDPAALKESLPTMTKAELEKAFKDLKGMETAIKYGPMLDLNEAKRDVWDRLCEVRKADHTDDERKTARIKRNIAKLRKQLAQVDYFIASGDRTIAKLTMASVELIMSSIKRDGGTIPEDLLNTRRVDPEPTLQIEQ